MKVSRLLELLEKKLRKKFIEDISFGDNKRDNIIIVEAKNDKTQDKLKRVVIENIPFASLDDRFHYLGFLEQDQDRELKGISTAGKSVDAIIVRFNSDGATLDVYLIELKSTLKNEHLFEIKEKIECSIFRLLLFLPYVEKDKKGEDFLSSLEVIFRVIVCYNGKNSTEDKSLKDVFQLYQALNEQKFDVEFSLPIDTKIKAKVKFISAHDEVIDYEEDTATMRIDFSDFIDFSPRTD